MFSKTTPPSEWNDRNALIFCSPRLFFSSSLSSTQPLFLPHASPDAPMLQGLSPVPPPQKLTTFACPGGHACAHRQPMSVSVRANLTMVMMGLMRARKELGQAVFSCPSLVKKENFVEGHRRNMVFADGHRQLKKLSKACIFFENVSCWLFY